MKKILFRNSFPRLFYACGIMLYFFSFNSVPNPLIKSAQSSNWSAPRNIPAFDSSLLVPVLVPDQNRTIHAFSAQWITSDEGRSVKAIVYNQWSIDYGWTEPVDILLSPIKEARITDAHLDKHGMMHIIFWGGDGTAAEIYYSRAPIGSLDNAQAWSAPEIIGGNAADPENAVFIEDSHGYFYVIYSGRDEGNGLYVVSSKDGGDTWSDATPIFLASNDAPSIYQIHAITGVDGWMHVIWNVYSFAGQGRGIYYVSSEDGETWSEPILLASATDGLGTQTPNIIEYDGTLFAVFNLPPKIMMRRSMDNGRTWQDPVILFPRHVGVNGNLSLVVDSADELHLFFGQRITGTPDIHGMWYSTWTKTTGRWTEPDAVTKGPRVVDKIGDTGFDPYDAHAAISQGNILLITWRTDPGDIKPNGVWFSYKVLDAPELPVAALPTSLSATDLTPQAVDILTATSDAMMPTITSTESYDRTILSTLQKTGQSDPSTLILIGITPAIILILIVLIRSFNQSRR